MTTPTQQELEQYIITLINDVLKINKPLTPSTHLIDELSFDSLDLLEVLVEVQEKYNFEMPHGKVEGIGTITETAEFLLKLIEANSV